MPTLGLPVTQDGHFIPMIPELEEPSAGKLVSFLVESVQPFRV
jgi:hypothetical protein